MRQPDMPNLQHCIEDVPPAGWEHDTGPAAPRPCNALRGRLQDALARRSPLYRQAVGTLFMQTRCAPLRTPQSLLP